MKKEQFLTILREKLSAFSENDLQKSLDFYGEMIDDRVEEGMAEEDAVAELGAPDAIVSQILLELSLPKLVKIKLRPRRALRTGEILLLILCSPLLLAAALVLFAAYLVLWVAVIALYAADLAFAASGTALAISAILSQSGSNDLLLTLGGSMVCIGVAILLFFSGNRAAAGVCHIGKKLLRSIKSQFIRKGTTA